MIVQELTLTVPALLFPAISLLFLAYTNRFLVLAQLIRDLKSRLKTEDYKNIIRQINNLNKRVDLIKKMQLLGVLSFIACSFSMFCIFIDLALYAKLSLGLSLILLILSLMTSLKEVSISTHAIHVELETLKE